MWTRADDSRQGRVHPMATSRIRARGRGGLGAQLRAAPHQRGDRLRPRASARRSRRAATKAPGGQLGVAATIFELTQVTPYNFGVSTRLLNEVDFGFNTVQHAQRLLARTRPPRARSWSTRSRTSWARTRTSSAPTMVKYDRWRNVLDRAAQEAGWGKSMPAGTAQGIGMHIEYKGARGLRRRDRLPRPEMVNRPIRDGRHRAARHQGDLRRRRRSGDQPARRRGADDGRHQRRASP